MSKIITPLSEYKIKSAKPKQKDYKLFDGGGLFLLVKTNGTKLWRYKYTENGKENLKSLGKYPEVSLANARLNKESFKTNRSNITLRDVVTEFLATKEKSCRKNYFNQMVRRINFNIPEYLLSKPIADIEKTEIAQLIKQINKRSAYSANVILTYFNNFYELAEASGYIKMVPSLSPKFLITKPEAGHRAFLSDEYELSAFLKTIKHHKNQIAYLMFKFLIYTVLREAEARLLRWDEIDFKQRLLILPPSRMKNKKEHKQPLSDKAIEILQYLKELNGSYKYVFYSHNNKSHFNKNILFYVIKKSGYQGKQTTHGFRHIFSTWANNTFPELGQVIEKALAHKNPNKSEDAYNKAEHLLQREKLLSKWADYIDGIENI